jgi:hypothetical protein
MDGSVDPSPVPSVESRERLLSLARGYRISQAIYVAARLGIPDLLADGPREIDELAHATGSHSQASAESCWPSRGPESSRRSGRAALA